MESLPHNAFCRNMNHLMNKGRVQEAIELIQEQIAINPQDDSLHYLLGNAYRRLSLWHKAIEHYAEAMELNAQSPARQARAMLLQIMEYRCTDLLNP